MELFDLHCLEAIEVAGGREHDEEAPAVPLDVRALPSLGHVLDDQGMELELAGRGWAGRG